MKNKKMETSKKIILFIGILFAVAIVYTIISCSISLIMNTYTDWTSIVALLTSTGGAFGTAIIQKLNQRIITNYVWLF